MRLSSRQQLMAMLALVFLVRLATLGMYPLTDTTEARYGEIARKMLETGQWIVPQIDYGVPFWGKPPLSFWLTAISYWLFGLSEFAARLPSFLVGVVTCVLAYLLGSRRRGVDHGLRTALVLATTLLMMVAAGGVMTDPAMMLGTSLSMVACWFAMTLRARLWGYLFFVGLAIGLLAKGPVATVLSLAPIGAWAIAMGRVRDLLRCLPWLTGLGLTGLLVVPWYWAAELQSPGFLKYFLLGEHWQRFMVAGWKGDLYGTAHVEMRGTIWLYALLGTLPWSAWLIWQLIRRKAALHVFPLKGTDGWMCYLLCWMLAPVVFFTMARNILPTYVMPGLIGFGLLVAEVLQQRQAREPAYRLPRLSLVTPVIVIALVFVIWPQLGFRSQREIVSTYRDSLEKDFPLVYFRLDKYSAEFYSRGRARQLRSEAALRQYLSSPTPTYIVTGPGTYAALPEDLRAQLTKVATSRSGAYVLLRPLVFIPAASFAESPTPMRAGPGSTPIPHATWKSNEMHPLARSPPSQ